MFFSPFCSPAFFSATKKGGETAGNGASTGAEKCRWDLTCLYSGLDDPRLMADIAEFERKAEAFAAEFRGCLAKKLDEALKQYQVLETLGGKPLNFLFLKQSLDTGDQTVKKLLSAAQERLSHAAGQHLVFFELEIAHLNDADIGRQADKSEIVRKHRPYLDRIRMFREHMLSEEVERALAKRNPFGPSSWAQFFDEVEADLRVKLPNGERPLTEALHLLTEERRADVRAKILAAIHEAIGGFFLKYSAETLMNVVRSKKLEDKERGYRHPMQSRNMSNMIDDAAVEALHSAVIQVGAPIMREHYRLKAAHLGLPRLAWSDRNAPLPLSDGTRVPFEEARRIVVAAYESFSPTLARLVREQFDAGRVDAPHTEGRRGGAYNCSFCLPGEQPISFTFLNYLGSPRDVSTLAHELGHSVHGLLAGDAQGSLMMQAPMAYAETASIFGEMVTFTHLMDGLKRAGNIKGALNLLLEKCDNFANSVMRQISFSEFERRVHEAAERLSADDLCRIWTDVTREMYGEDGDVFTYTNIERLWSYVSHFHRPFYVYAYAAGEIFTQSLFARREEFGDRFEAMYLELLRAGATKNAAELLKPFGLNPADPSFWETGIRASYGQWVKDAVQLSERMSVSALKSKKNLGRNARTAKSTKRRG